MKTILVDAVHGFVVEDNTGGYHVFQPMYDLLETFPNRKILLTGAGDEAFKIYGLDKMPYEVFTLKHNPPKSNPDYYRTMLESFGLTPDEVVHFEHNKEAVKSAELVGIKTYYYDEKTQDLAALRSYLVQNL